MKPLKRSKVQLGVLASLLCIHASSLCAAESVVRPVTPNASPEAVELLKFIHGISGQHNLSGQHNYPSDKDRQTTASAKTWGKTPAVFGKDWGFAKEGDKDSAFVRSEIVEELIEHYRNGSIVTMCWHEVPPTADEPVTFRARRGGGGTNGISTTSALLNTVQGQLTEAQCKDLLTPGTELHQRWCAQVDAIVPHLKKLEEARVPLLWRPFHEMNGTWFWWGGRRGEYGTAAMYKMMFDRLVKHHKIKNLIWIWSVDRPEGTSLKFEDCWPGPDCVDILSLDCYQEFKQSYYEDLLKLANGKPIALAEVGNNLSLRVLEAQPKWTWWMTWAGMGTRGDATNRFPAIVNAPHSWSLSDPDYRKAIAPIRAASGLPTEPPPPPP